jgi:hypothetical protein
MKGNSRNTYEVVIFYQEHKFINLKKKVVLFIVNIYSSKYFQPSAKKWWLGDDLPSDDQNSVDTPKFLVSSRSRWPIPNTGPNREFEEIDRSSNIKVSAYYIEC